MSLPGFKPMTKKKKINKQTHKVPVWNAQQLVLQQTERSLFAPQI
jgi:hypothetical protein